MKEIFERMLMRYLRKRGWIVFWDELGTSITVWKDGRWRPWNRGGAWEAEGDQDWLLTINLSELEETMANIERLEDSLTTIERLVAHG